MTAVPLHAPTLLDLVDAVYEFAESSEEAAAVVNHLLRAGRVRVVNQPPRSARAALQPAATCRNAQVSP
jgi:hypothetical protein